VQLYVFSDLVVSLLFSILLCNWVFISTADKVFDRCQGYNICYFYRGFVYPFEGLLKFNPYLFSNRKISEVLNFVQLCVLSDLVVSLLFSILLCNWVFISTADKVFDRCKGYNICYFYRGFVYPFEGLLKFKPLSF
jgi:hypothetical protein